MVDIEYPYFSLFRCNAVFRCCKRFTAITGHNKQMPVAFKLRVQKCEWRFLLRNSRNVFMNVDLEIFVKTHVLLYFYNETEAATRGAL